MKKRLLLLMATLLLTFVLAGCDLFGGGTITIPTDTSATTSDTGSTTTTTTTSGSVSTTTTTTTTNTGTTTTTTTNTTTDTSVFTISFEENGGSVVSNITLSAGSAVSAPIAPSKTGYSFAGWFSDTGLNNAYTFTTMPSQNITLYAKWQIMTYTVTFYAEDGETVLDTQTVEFGSAALPPEAPLKEGFAFGGWDKDYMTITGNVSIIATYVSHYEPLVLMIQDLFGYEGMPAHEMDQIISGMLFIMDVETEEEVYTMMTGAMLLGEGLMDVSDLAEFQAWFAGLALQGMTEEQIVDMMVNAALFAVQMAARDFNEQEYLDQIAFFEGERQLVFDGLDDLENALGEYCDSLDSEAIIPCYSYFDALLSEFNLSQDYQHAMNSIWDLYGEDFDYGFYYDLEYKMYNYLATLYLIEDEVEALNLLNAIQSQLAMVSSSEQAMYESLLTLYSDWTEYMMVDTQAAFDAVSTYIDENDVYVYDYVQSHLYYPYQNLLYQIESYNWMIEEEYQWMYEEQAHHAMMMDLRDYLWSVEGTNQLKTLAITLYDMVDSLVYNIDEPTFNMILDLIQGVYNETPPPMEAADISSYALMVVDILSALEASVDDDDIANIIALGTSVAEIFLAHSDMDELQKTYILNLIETLAPVYFDHAAFIYSELIDLLEGVTPEKVQLVLDFIDYMNQGEEGSINLMMIEEERDPYEMVVYIAQIVDAFLYDGTFDIYGIADIAVDVYYDWAPVYADETTILAVKNAVRDALTQIVLLSHEVALIDLENVTSDDMAAMYELYQRGQHLVDIISEGDLAQILVPYDYTDVHDLFVQFINPWGEMSDEEVDALIDVILYTFDTESEADVLFTLMQLKDFPGQLEYVESFEDVQALYLQLAPMGFDNATLSGMLARFLESYSDYMMTFEYDPYYLDELQGYYDDAYAEYLYWQEELVALQVDIDYEISLLSDPAKTDAQSLWNYFLYNRQLENDFWMYYSLYQYDYGFEWTWEDYDTYWYIDDLLNRYYQTVGGNDIPPELQVTYEQYHAEFNALSEYEHMMFDTILYYADINYSYHWTVYYPAMRNFEMNYAPWSETPINTSFGQPINYWMMDNINEYNRIMSEMDYYLQQMRMYEDEMSYGNDDEAWLYIDAFFDDPENVGLVEDMALVLLDEVGSLIMYSDTDSVNLVIGLMSGTINPSILDLTPVGIRGYLDAFEDFWGYLFSTFDSADQIVIETFITKVVYFYVGTMELPELEAEEFASMLSTKLINYLLDFALLKDEISAFLPTITVSDIEIIMNSINIMSSLPEPMDEEEELNNNLIRAIEMAKIIDVLLAGDVMNTDHVVSMVVSLYFDISNGFMYDGSVDLETLSVDLQGMVDDIIVQATIIQAYDNFIDEVSLVIAFDDPFTTEIPEGITDTELSEIDLFHILIEDLMNLFDAGLENYNPIV